MLRGLGFGARRLPNFTGVLSGASQGWRLRVSLFRTKPGASFSTKSTRKTCRGRDHGVHWLRQCQPIGDRLLGHSGSSGGERRCSPPLCNVASGKPAPRALGGRTRVGRVQRAEARERVGRPCSNSGCSNVRQGLIPNRAVRGFLPQSRLPGSERRLSRESRSVSHRFHRWHGDCF